FPHHAEQTRARSLPGRRDPRSGWPHRRLQFPGRLEHRLVGRKVAISLERDEPFRVNLGPTFNDSRKGFITRSVMTTIRGKLPACLPFDELTPCRCETCVTSMGLSGYTGNRVPMESKAPVLLIVLVQ